jgi:glutathione synthase/RimK-type ligase-like ATP-grasp enzyme
MILICGIPTEPPVEMVTAALDEIGLLYAVVHQRRFMETLIDIEIVDGTVRGRLTVEGRNIACADVSGIYTRLMDWRVLPELSAAGAAMTRRCQLWHDALTGLIEIAPVRVMNRAAAMASNQSKPYQAQLIRNAGFRVPETLVTNDPELVRAFRAQHGDVIYKSISGTRSIVRMLDDTLMERLPLVHRCPVQFQRFIAGTNVRVHVVAGEPFATRIDTDCVDYRYAQRDGGNATLTPHALPDALAEKCVALVAGLGLELAGIDLLVTAAGEAYCLEVNPSPAFSFFERHTGQPIARAIALALARRPDPDAGRMGIARTTRQSSRAVGLDCAMS